MRRFFRALRLATYASADRPNLIYTEDGSEVRLDDGSQLEVE